MDLDIKKETRHLKNKHLHNFCSFFYFNFEDEKKSEKQNNSKETRVYFGAPGTKQGRQLAGTTPLDKVDFDLKKNKESY